MELGRFQPRELLEKGPQRLNSVPSLVIAIGTWQKKYIFAISVGC